MSVVAWVVILVLCAVTALYVAAEFAAVSVRRSRVHQLAQDGNRLARMLLPILEDPAALDRYIAACQIGITISSLVLGAFGQAALGADVAGLFERYVGLESLVALSAAALAILVFLTVLHMVIGELIPKSLALQYPTQVAIWTVVPMRWSLVALSPFIKFLNGSGVAILKLLGAPQTGHRHIHSPEEIDLLFAESRDGGLLEPDEHYRLQQALRLGLRPAHQLMVPRVRLSAVSSSASPDELLERVLESPYTRLLVAEGSTDAVVGAVHARDVVVAYAERGAPPPLAEVVRPIPAVPETVTADRLLALMRERRTHLVLVVDEFGSVEGIVTLEDVLEEVFGEIGDEHIGAGPRPERLEDGRVRLPGGLRLDEAEPWINALWEGEADTVGGHVTYSLGRIAAPGDRVTLDGVEVEVERVERRRVVSVLARPVPAAEPQEERQHG